MKHRIYLLALCLLAGTGAFAQSPEDWYPVSRENKPYVRWWWLGSAVDKPGLSYNLEEFAKAGLGGVEITPIYGVQGNEANDLPFLSEKWMDMYNFTVAKAGELDLEVDMNCGTGWPFGGPEITPELAAKKMLVKNGTITAVPTGQKVKRAAPGGEGLVMNHYDAAALKLYLDKFDKAFADSDAPWPHTWFNDSYEVYGADWTEKLPEIFADRYGYDIVAKLVSATGEERLRALCDYRECLGDILYENFLQPWTAWAHKHGAKVRNQSHGSPANILDFYASVDIPECETYGRTDFDIPGLRRDPLKRPNDGDPCALKFASSAAHLSGAKYVSCETLTWLTEHFRTSLSQCKPEIDQAFCAGVNHIFFHGAPYSPYGAEFPGWRFYASVNMSPTEQMWKDAPALFDYVTRCQAFLSAGDPDSDFLLYLPIYDAWSKDTGRDYMMFDIHGMDKTMPEAKRVMKALREAGFDADYVSDNLLSYVGTDKPIIVPACKRMPVETVKRLISLRESGVQVIILDSLPEDVPGLYDLEFRRREFRRLVSRLGKPVSLEQALKEFQPESFKTVWGGEYVRRINEYGGYNYFLTKLSAGSIDGWVKLSTPARSAIIFDPMHGTSGKAELRMARNGRAEVRLQLEPGESILLKTLPFNIDCEPWAYVEEAGEAVALLNGWSVSFPESVPAIKGNFNIKNVKPWTDLDIPEAKVNMATARYTTAIYIDPEAPEQDDWILDLGDVRESARVYINGEYVSTLVSVPFKVSIGKWLKPGFNALDVWVTNLASNRIADYDRREIKWRIFKDANIANLPGTPVKDYSDWKTDPSGLNSQVSIIPVKLSVPPVKERRSPSMDPTFTAQAVLAATRKVNDHFMRKYSDPTKQMAYPSRKKIYETNIWTRAVYFEGLMALYSADPCQRYLDYTRTWGDFHNWDMRYGQTLTRNADNYCCAQTYIDMYRITGEEKMIAKTRECIDNIVATPESDGDWTWIDAIQMGMPVLVKLGHTEKAWKMYNWARERFYNPEEGFWYRDKDFVAPYKGPGGVSCYWSRGEGWVFAALVRVLDELPAGAPHRDIYEADFKAMAAALVECQRPDGTWNPSVLDPSDFGGPEASGTSLFTYGIAWGIRKGLLDRKTYYPVVEHAWKGLCRLCLHADGFIGFSQGTGKQPSDSQPLSYDRIPDFDDFGTGCVLLAGSEVVKLLSEAPAPVFSATYDVKKQTPFRLDIPVPDGNYLVTVVLGGRSKGNTTIKGESRRLFVLSESTSKTEKTIKFVVNKRDLHIRENGAVVHDVNIKPRENGKLNWDDNLTLEILGSAPAVKSITVTPAPESTVTAFLCGDSTVVDQDNEPWASWGQMAPYFFDSSVAIANYAESGERSDSFIGAGRLDKILSVARPGDYLFVEFGHNDQKLKGPDKNGYCHFAEQLRIFIDAARSKGMIPVLVTPTHRRNFDAEGRIVETHEDYPDGMRYVASREGVTLIDLHEMSGAFYESMGLEGSKKAFVQGDNTHFNGYGAFELARRVVKDIKEQGLPLASRIVNEEAVFVQVDSPHVDLAAQALEKDDKATETK